MVNLCVLRYAITIESKCHLCAYEILNTDSIDNFTDVNWYLRRGICLKTKKKQKIKHNYLHFIKVVSPTQNFKLKNIKIF